MKINLYNRQKDLIFSKNAVRAIVHAALDHFQTSCKELSIYFVTDKQIAALHGHFFQDPTPTDCISFPLQESHLGEIFICPLQAKIYANKKNLNAYDETALYIIHGLLHLLGHDDVEKKGRSTMRKKEKSCMRHLCKQGITLRPILL